MLKKLLDEAEITNLLIESCRLYLSSELFITELDVLAYFNHHVTFPFLNCIENSNQIELLKILPQLYKDLCLKKVNTLKDFQVNIHGIEN